MGTTYDDNFTENEKKYQITSLAHIREWESNSKQPLDVQLFNKSLRIRDLQMIFEFIWSSKYVTVLDLGR